MFPNMTELEKLPRLVVGELVMFLGEISRDLLTVAEEVNLGVLDLESGGETIARESHLAGFGSDIGQVSIEARIADFTVPSDADRNEYITLRQWGG